jgi:hypothetical protein
MPYKFLWFLQPSTVLGIKAATSRSQNYGRKECRGTTRHVDDTSSRKIDNARSKQGIIIGGTQKSIRTPNGMCYYGIDKTRQQQ